MGVFESGAAEAPSGWPRPSVKDVVDDADAVGGTCFPEEVEGVV